ncbi:MAG: hypothetical protein HGA87_07310 [Desulfobulbaceae bacterium]|nr:hypothetical protein [Desulfobulbaceae bacterium]
MSEDAASNILPFKAKTLSDKGCELSRTLDPKEVHALSALIRHVAYEIKTEEAEIFEIAQRVFGIWDLRHIPARDLEAVTNFLVGLIESSTAAKKL